jgi:alpha-tubulin suppressor-like RCC1 family protein
MAELFSFGHSKHGQLGRDGNSRTPAVVLSGALTEISCGGTFSEAIIGGNIVSWGDSRGTRPTKHHSFRNPIFKIASGILFTVGLDYEGAVYCWGVTKDQHTVHQLYPRRLEGDLQPQRMKKPQIIAMSSGATFALFLDNSGHVYAFGEGPCGQCGFGQLLTSSEPKLIPHFQGTSSALGQVKSVACGGHHSMALTDRGLIFTWGNNEFGQLGNGTLKSSDLPQPAVGLPSIKIVAIAAGEYHSFIVTEDKRLYACGKNDQGQLGISKTSDYETSWIHVETLENVKSVVAGGGLRSAHSLALTDTGLYSWGNGSFGQLGYPLEPGQKIQMTPKRIDFGDRQVASFACGWLHTLVLMKGNVVPLSSFMIQHDGLGGLDLLPTDILGLILDSLNVIDVSRLGICSRILFGFTSSPSFWKRAFKIDILSYLSENTLQRYLDLFHQIQVNWKFEYIKCCSLINTRYKEVKNFDLHLQQMASTNARLLSCCRFGLTIPLCFSKPVSILMTGYPKSGKKTILGKLAEGRGGYTKENDEHGDLVLRLSVQNCNIISWMTSMSPYQPQTSASPS